MKIVGQGARIAFQGERGAFSEEAAIALLGEPMALVPRPTFEALFASIEEGASDYVLAPIENSLAGSVHRTYDLLLERSLYIVAETVIPIAHHLIGCPQARFEDVRTVESHPVALAQCERFFAAHPHLKRIVADDTAGSVRHIVELGDPTRAAIAGARAAEVYGGRILREHLEDHRENYTRFVLLTNAPRMVPDADKLSLVLRLKHEPGALYRALEPFARRAINLLKIESRPVAGQPWQYRFYLDLQVEIDAPELSAALADLRARVDQLRVLGSYRAARL
ncbi:MAG: prephenate dehydratase [Pyrinomonas sp.]|uniref:prephenate dehydratase n=1 Tax=Pyrinomonas sp. TaxID=2080306 RepID=UPI00332E2D35